MRTLDELRRNCVYDLFSDLEKIRNAHFSYPNGRDIRVQPHIVQQLNAYCDEHNIPLYVVTDSVVSTAPTYNQLYDYESKR